VKGNDRVEMTQQNIQEAENATYDGATQKTAAKTHGCRVGVSSDISGRYRNLSENYGR
jgi:hypothetical protein